MTNETAINRTAESFGQKIEREALEAQEPASDPSQTAEASNASKTGRIEIPIPAQFTPTAVPGLYPKQYGELASSRAAVTTKTVYTVSEHVGGAEVSVWETEGGQAIIDKVVEQAAVELGASAVAFSEQPEPTHKPLNVSASGVPVEDWSDSGHGHFTTAQIVALTANELIDFKEKVIAAFKHLGLDTRKHFGV